MGLKLRHDTAANWTSANPTLEMAERGYETDTQKWKTGDGSTAWVSLAYDATGGGVWGSITGTLSSQSDLNTALGLKAPLASPTFTGTVTLPTGLTGLVKTASGVVSAATAGTDYYNPGGTDVAVADGGTGASSASAARTNLGLAIGTDVLAPTGSGASLTGIYLPGGTDVAVADGGTGASTASAARTNLGLVIGTDVQAHDADLDTIAGLTATTDNFMVAASSAWASRTPAQARTSLGLVIGTNVQAWDTDLDTWATKTAPSGTAVGTSDTQTLTNKRVTARVVAILSSATPTLNTDNADVGDCLSLATNITSMTTNLSGTPTARQPLMLYFKDNGTPRTITWGASFGSSGVATLLATTVANMTHAVGLRWDAAASKWICLAVDAVGY